MTADDCDDSRLDDQHRGDEPPSHLKRGLFSRSAADIQLRAIEQVRLQQGVVARLLNMERVEIRGTGVDDVRLPAIADPVALQRSIQEAWIWHLRVPPCRPLPLDGIRVFLPEGCLRRTLRAPAQPSSRRLPGTMRPARLKFLV